MRRLDRRGLLFALGAVAFFSTSPVLTLWADPLSPFVKTGGRLAVAALALGVALALRRPRDAPPAAAPASRSRRATVLRYAGYGLIAALHFLGYIAALSLTSPAHALTLVYTAPIFVALGAGFLLHEPIHRRQWAGIAVAVAGVAVLADPLAAPPQ